MTFNPNPSAIPNKIIATIATVKLLNIANKLIDAMINAIDKNVEFCTPSQRIVNLLLALAV